jgi:ribosomal protein S18 acetylase RimI-like enzyme
VIPRDAAKADLAGLARILGDWAEATPWMPKLHSCRQNLGFLRGLHQSGVLRVIGDPAQGFLARQETEIPALFVAASARGRGIGRALVRDAMEGASVLRLWTFQANAPARAFYRALGFAEIAWTDGAGNEERLPDVRLEWRRG